MVWDFFLYLVEPTFIFIHQITRTHIALTGWLLLQWTFCPCLVDLLLVWWVVFDDLFDVSSALMYLSTFTRLFLHPLFDVCPSAFFEIRYIGFWNEECNCRAFFGRFVGFSIALVFFMSWPKLVLVSLGILQNYTGHIHNSTLAFTSHMENWLLSKPLLMISACNIVLSLLRMPRIWFFWLHP